MNTKSLNFLTQLKINNHKSWFDEHRLQYEQAKQDFQDLVKITISNFIDIEPTLTSLEVKDCIFRINRDVRFSKDKSPYKINFSAFFAQGGRKGLGPGYYLHIQPEEGSFVAGGIYQPDAFQLQKIRQEIDYNPDSFLQIINDPDFSRYFSSLSIEHSLVNPPKGYTVENPMIKYLKLKSFVVTHPFTDEEVLQTTFPTHITHVFKQIAKLNAFLKEAI